jgi:hypothetical protein
MTEIVHRCSKLESLRTIPANVISATKNSLPNLTDLSSQIASDEDLSAIAALCPSLKNLEIDQTVFAIGLLNITPVFQQCLRIRTMTLWGFDFSSEALMAFANLKLLEELLIFASSMSDTQCDLLAQSASSRLTKLKLSGLAISINGIHKLSKLRQIKQLNLTYTSACHALPEFFQLTDVFPQLEVLTVNFDLVNVIKMSLQQNHPDCEVNSQSWY